MAKSKGTAAERRAKLAAERKKLRDEALAELPEIQRIAASLRELGDSTANPVLRAEIMALSDSSQRTFDLLQRKVDMLAGPGIAELLLPSGVYARLQEAHFQTVQELRVELDEGGSTLLRLPFIGAVTCEMIRAHIEAFDAVEHSEAKAENGKAVDLSAREKQLAERLGLSLEQASDFLKNARAKEEAAKRR